MKRVSRPLVTQQVSPPFLWDHRGVTEKVRLLTYCPDPGQRLFVSVVTSNSNEKFCGPAVP